MEELALRYAQALFLLSKEKNQVLEYQEEIKTLREILEDNEDFISLINDAFISLEERKSIIDKTLSSFNDDIIKLSKILLDNSRGKLLLEVLDAFNSLVNKYRGVDEGYIYTALPLKDKEIENVTSKVSEVEGRPIFLKQKIDKSLIGGIKVVINDHVYDCSIKASLDLYF